MTDTTTARSFLKHASGTIWAVEASPLDGLILAALDVTSEAQGGGLCAHLLATLPLAGRLDDVEYLNRVHAECEAYDVDCTNVHHLMDELLDCERGHRAAAAAFAQADARAKSLKKDMEASAAKVHDLLGRIVDRKPLPLFDAIGG